MKERGLIVVSLDEIANRWQIPVEVLMRFIVELGMPMEEKERGQWFAEHTDLILEEKQKAFDDSLFPRHLRPEPTETTS